MTWATGTAVLGPYFKVRYLGHPLAAPIPLSRVHRPTECAHQEPMFSLDPTLNTGNLETPYSDGPTATPRACTAASIVHLHRSQLTVTKLPQEHRKLQAALACRGWYVHVGGDDSGLQAAGPLFYCGLDLQMTGAELLKKHRLSV